ncbi:MAG: hypothetical protein JXB04_03475 [Kiritimatiellae bacterium]|nr:hypothetical protein [Kiritimatiellia bacterium]
MQFPSDLLRKMDLEHARLGLARAEYSEALRQFLAANDVEPCAHALRLDMIVDRLTSDAAELRRMVEELRMFSKPRGEGLWIFSLVGRTADRRTFVRYARFFGKYGDTKRQAIAAARAAQAEVVLVMP